MKKNNIAVLASGTGSNTRKLISYFGNREIADIVLVISNNPKAGVLQIAKDHNIPFVVLNKKELNTPNISLNLLKNKGIDWIILAGFLLKIPEYLVDAFPNRIINIHPALLPKYGGKGMYGSHVHEAVIRAGEKESGITIHYVNKEYDEGATILQKKCRIDPEDDAERLAQKIHLLEHEWFPKTIEKVIKES